MTAKTSRKKKSDSTSITPTAAVPSAQAAQPLLETLPISKEELQDPLKFSEWLFSHAPLVLKALFKTIPEVPPVERAKLLIQLFTTMSTHRPFKAIDTEKTTTNEPDPTSILSELLAVSPKN